MRPEPAYEQVAILGTGRVARAFALALAPLSRKPLLIHGRTPGRVEEILALCLGARQSPDLSTLSNEADLILLAISDDALADVVDTLAQAGPFTRAPFIFHVSGQSGDVLLAPLRMAGAVSAAIHPVMTFTGDPEQEVRRMVGARFAVTAIADDALARAQLLVEQVGGQAIVIKEADRTLYHGALCHAANHLVTLLAGASDALSIAGVDEPQALLAPLVRAALENSLTKGFGALSGPLLRGDEGTIRDHLQAFENRCPDLLPAYRAMALATLDRLESSRPTSPGLRAAFDD